MKINFETVEFEGSKRLEDFVEKKITKLERFFDKIIQADVTLRKTQDKVLTSEVEVKLKVPNDILFASSKATSYEEATASTIEALERQLKKYKEKMKTN